MLRKVGVLLIVTSLLFVILGAGRVAKKEVELELVWEKEFDKKIEEVAFGETENGMLYPKIVVFEDEVRFYNENFHRITTCPYTRYSKTIFSKNSNYIGIQTIERHATKAMPGQTETAIYTDKGKRIWRNNEKNEFDIPLPILFISTKDGSAVAAKASDGKLLFLDKSGEELKKYDLFKDDEWDMARNLYGAFSEDGKYFVINVQECPFVPVSAISKEYQGRSGNPWLILFNDEAEELWRYKMPAFSSDGVAISPRGEYIVGTGIVFDAKEGIVDCCTSLLNKEGEIIQEYPIFSRKIAFSPDGECISMFYREPVPTIQLVRSENGTVLWKYETPWEDVLKESIGELTFISVSSKREVVAIFKGKGYNAATRQHFSALPQVWIFSPTGDIIYKRTFHHRNLLNSILSTEGKWLGISTRKNIDFFKRGEK